MITWKSLVGDMETDMRNTQLDEEARFDSSFKAEDDEFLTHMHDMVYAKIADYNDSLEDDLEEKVVYKSGIRSKRWAILAASLVLVLGLGVTSVGSKPYVMKVVNMVLGGKEAVMVDTGDSDNTYDVDTRANDAAVDINDKLGIISAKMEYLPYLMEYKDYTVDSDTQEAEIIYGNEEGAVLTYSIAVNEVNSFVISGTENRLLQEYDLEIKKHNISVSEYEDKNTKQRQFVAIFSDEGVFYNISSNVKQKEFDEIIKNIYFIKK